MNQPVFPQKFVRNHCRKVLEARDWRKVYQQQTTESLGDDESDMQYAECAFNPAGAGMLCEVCDLHLTRPFLNHRIDEEFLPQIEEFYRRLKECDEMAEKEPEKLSTPNKIIKGLAYLGSEAAMYSTENGVCAEHDIFYAFIEEDDSFDAVKIAEVVSNMERLGWTRNDLNGSLSFEINV